jgi:XTP/dITP diphosphohydrolase
VDVQVPDRINHGDELSPLLLATSNQGKVRELADLLRPLRIEVVTPRDLGLRLELAETGTTFAENARLKAEAFAVRTGRASLADDSGLVVDALGGEPGVRSARYGGPGLDDAGRVKLLLERLRDIPPHERGARFAAALALARPGRPTIEFDGVVEGLIAREPRGTGGFGYDPVFIYPPAGQTFAEMTSGAKAAVSHRGRAMRQFIEYLRQERVGMRPIY